MYLIYLIRMYFKKPVAEIREHQVSNRRQPAGAPLPGAPVALSPVCSVVTCTFLLCSVMAFCFLSKMKLLSIDFLGFPIFPGSLGLLGPGHVLWICFQLQAFSCSSVLPLALPHGHFAPTTC